MSGKVLSSRNLPSYEDLEAEVAGLWDDIGDMIINRTEVDQGLGLLENSVRRMDALQFALNQNLIADCIADIKKHLNKV